MLHPLATCKLFVLVEHSGFTYFANHSFRLVSTELFFHYLLTIYNIIGISININASVPNKILAISTTNV